MDYQLILKLPESIKQIIEFFMMILQHTNEIGLQSTTRNSKKVEEGRLKAEQWPGANLRDKGL